MDSREDNFLGFGGMECGERDMWMVLGCLQRRYHNIRQPLDLVHLLRGASPLSFRGYNTTLKIHRYRAIDAAFFQITDGARPLYGAETQGFHKADELPHLYGTLVADYY